MQSVVNTYALEAVVTSILEQRVVEIDSQSYYYNTTALIKKTFGLLADKVCSVHLKDIKCDPAHMFPKWDEVHIGDGVMDYDTYLKKLATLDPDMPCYCEHFMSEGDFAISLQPSTVGIKPNRDHGGVDHVP